MIEEKARRALVEAGEQRGYGSLVKLSRNTAGLSGLSPEAVDSLKHTLNNNFCYWEGVYASGRKLQISEAALQ